MRIHTVRVLELRAALLVWRACVADIMTSILVVLSDVEFFALLRCSCAHAVLVAFVKTIMTKNFFCSAALVVAS